MAYNIKKQYNRIAACYKKFEEDNPRKHILIKKQFVKALRSLRGLFVLDLGCGAGFFSLLAKRLGAKYVLGVDISQKMIDLAKEKTDQAGLDIDYKKCDIADLRVSKKFDIAVAGFVFSYSPDKITLRKYLGSASRHLKYGGRLFAVLCNPSNPIRDKKVLYRVVPATKGKLKDGSKLRCEFYDGKGNFLCYDYKFLWSKQTIEGVLKKLGFQDIKWIDIKNLGVKKLKILSLPSTNIILYAIKKR